MRPSRMCLCVFLCVTLCVLRCAVHVCDFQCPYLYVILCLLDLFLSTGAVISSTRDKYTLVGFFFFLYVHCACGRNSILIQCASFSFECEAVNQIRLDERGADGNSLMCSRKRWMRWKWWLRLRRIFFFFFDSSFLWICWMDTGIHSHKTTTYSNQFLIHLFRKTIDKFLRFYGLSIRLGYLVFVCAVYFQLALDCIERIDDDDDDLCAPAKMKK